MTNLAFTALIKSKGYNQKSLAEEADIPPGVLSHRINGLDDWHWPEVSRICEALGITYDEFAAYFPVANVRQTTKPAAKTKNECICEALDNLKMALTTN